MADGKWISDLEATTPLADAARRVLTVRLEVVRDYLPLAQHEADKDPENVHQLRVGTRRAGAAVEIFADCLPEKTYKCARRRLRQIRRAAGAARDWDVFLINLTEWGKEHAVRSHRAGLDFLIGYGIGQRTVAQSHLEEIGDDYPFSFDKFLAETVAAVDDRPVLRELGAGAVLVDLARPVLGKFLQELDDAAAQDLGDYENLHQVRIAGKRLRYAMEIFADCFAPAFREELYPAIEQMQEILGNANDSHVADGRLSGVCTKLKATRSADWKRFKPGIEALLRFHRQRLPRERQRFLAWWKKWQGSGTEDRLAGLVHERERAV